MKAKKRLFPLLAFALALPTARALDVVAEYRAETGFARGTNLRFADGKALRPRTGVVNPDDPAHVEVEIDVAANAGVTVFLVQGRVPKGFASARNRDKIRIVPFADAARFGYANLPGVDLDRNAGLSPEEYGARLAAAKAEAVRARRKGVFVGAWNDYAHARFLVPDERENDYYLRAVARVFGRHPADVYLTCSAEDAKDPAKAHPRLWRLRRPDVENVAYGPHLRQRLDVWLPRGAKGRVPCLVQIHGGAWVDGCSLVNAAGCVARGDARGVAVVSISYRMIPDADAARHVPGIEWPLDDAVAALALVKDHADDWGLDVSRIGLVGGSAGAGSALYAALQGDNALGIYAVSANSPQTSYDPTEFRQWILGAFYGAHAFGYGYSDGAVFAANRAKWLPWIERYSPAALARRIDPKRAPRVFLQGSPLPMPGEPPPGGVVHAGAYCTEFKRICDAHGVWCEYGTVDNLLDALQGDDVRDPFASIRARLARGEKNVKVAKDVYSVAPTGPDRRVYLKLTGLSDVTIDFGGSKILGRVKTRLVELQACTNVTIRNFTLDYTPLTFTQGIIEKVDADRNWDVRIIPGYPCPTEAELKGVTWPVQVYAKEDLELKNPNRYRDGIKVTRTGDVTYRVTGGVDRRGDAGDVCVWSLTDNRTCLSDVVRSEWCHGCRYENITVYATPDGCIFAENYSHGATYRNCRLVRCPVKEDSALRALKRVRSGNHDALNARFGDTVTIDGCEFAYHCDDSINISGYYSVVTKCEGNRIRVIPAFGRGGLFEPGDTIQILTFEGLVPPDAKVLAVEAAPDPTDEERRRILATNLREPLVNAVKKALVLTLDRAVDFSFGTVVISNERMGNGFAIRNCTFGSTRARAMLIKASNGLIENNTIERSYYDAISIYPEYYWLEGGCSRNVTIRGNTLRNNGGGIHIGGTSGNGTRLPPDAHSGMALENNTIIDSPKRR